MPDLTWLSLSVGAEDSLERALSRLIRMTSLGVTAELLFVTRGEIEAWARRAQVPEEYSSPIRDELAKQMKAQNGPEYQSGNGNWTRYRAEFAAGHGSQAEIAARHNVTRQAVNRALALDPSRKTEPEPELEAPVEAPVASKDLLAPAIPPAPTKRRR